MRRAGARLWFLRSELMLEVKENSTSHNWPHSASWELPGVEGQRWLWWASESRLLPLLPGGLKNTQPWPRVLSNLSTTWVNPKDLQLAVPEARTAPGLFIHLVSKGQPLELTEASVTPVSSSSYTLHLHVQYPVNTFWASTVYQAFWGNETAVCIKRLHGTLDSPSYHGDCCCCPYHLLWWLRQ